MNLREGTDRRQGEAPAARRAHEFPADIVRAGGRVTKATYKLQCSKCQRATVYEAVSTKPDARVAEKFQKRGWLLGKTRNADICPNCLGGSSDGISPESPTTNKPEEMVLSPAQIAEQLFMPHKKGEGTPVVVTVQAGRPMSRARQQAEAQASSVFKLPGAAKPTLTLGGPKAPSAAATPAPQVATQAAAGALVASSPIVSPAPVPQEGDPDFKGATAESVQQMRAEMSQMTVWMQSMMEQISLMAQAQAGFSTSAEETAKLQRQSIEAVARLSTMQAAQSTMLEGGFRELRQTRNAGDLVTAAIVEAVEDASSRAATTPAVVGKDAGIANQGAVEGKRGRRTKAEMEAFRAEQEKLAALGLKRGRGRPPKNALSDAQVAEIVASKDPAAAKARIESSARAASDEATAAPSSETASAKDGESLGAAAPTKRRGRPPKAAAGADASASVPVDGAAEDAAPVFAPAPVEAALVAASVQAEPAPEGKRRGRPPKAAATAEAAPVVAPALAEPAPEGKRRGRKPKAAAAVEAAPVVASAPTEPAPKRRGRPPKAASTAEAAPVVAAAPAEPAPAGKRRGRKPKVAATAEAAPIVAPAPAEPAPESKRRGRKPKAAAAVEAASVVASAPTEPAPKRRGRPPKAAATAEAAPIVAPAPAEPAPEGKVRGRKPQVAVSSEAAPVVAPAPAEPGPGGKRRGRPPKAAAATQAAPVVAAAPAEPATVGKRRGRPPKAAPAAEGKRRGRPPKASGPAAAGKALSAVNWAKIKPSADVMVQAVGSNTKFQFGRKVWDAAGFKADEAVDVLMSGEEIQISKLRGGTKPSSAKGGVVILEVPILGETSLWQIKYAAENGSLYLRGKSVG